MIRNFMKSQISEIWRTSADVAGRAAGLAGSPLLSMAGVASPGVQQALSMIGSGAVAAMKASMRVGEDLQRRAVDLAFDAVELQPVTDALAEAGLPVVASHDKRS